MLKNLISLLPLFLFLTHADANETQAFEKFTGKYKVVSALCQNSDAGCAALKEVMVTYGSGQVPQLEIRETREQGVTPIKLVQFDQTDAHGRHSWGQIEGDGSFLVSYTTGRFYHPDHGTVLESRSMSRFANLIQYSYHHQLIGNADGNDHHFERHYTLQKVDAGAPVSGGCTR